MMMNQDHHSKGYKKEEEEEKGKKEEGIGQRRRCKRKQGRFGHSHRFHQEEEG